MSLFTDRVRTGAYLARFCFIGAMITYFLFVSQFLQDVQGWTALQAGLWFLPMTIVNFAVATAVPRLTSRFGAARMMVAGIALGRYVLPAAEGRHDARTGPSTDFKHCSAGGGPNP